MRTIDFDHRAADAVALDAARDEVLAEPDIVYNKAYGGFWIAAHFDHVTAIVRDHARFGSADGVNYPRPPLDFPALPIEADAPDHRDYRRLLTPLVTASRVESYDPVIRSYAASLLHKFGAAGQVWDAISNFALPVPVYAAAAMFGISGAEFDDFNKAITHLNHQTILGNDELLAAANIVAFDMFKRCLKSAHHRPFDETDLFSILVHATMNGRPLTHDEQLGTALTTANGASSTTSEAIGFMTYHLATRPGLFERIADDPTLVEPFIEESLRANSPVWHLFRTVLTPVTIGGVDMKPGDKVMVAYAWANHDAARFSDPDNIDIDIKRPTHLAFSGGVHRCVGLHLARLQLRIVVQELVRTWSGIELVGALQPPRAHFGTRGFDQLDVRLVPK